MNTSKSLRQPAFCLALLLSVTGCTVTQEAPDSVNVKSNTSAVFFDEDYYSIADINWRLDKATPVVETHENRPVVISNANQNRVINATAALMVYDIFRDDDGNQQTVSNYNGDNEVPLGGICGITFISPSYAITSAHCARSVTPEEDLEVWTYSVLGIQGGEDEMEEYWAHHSALSGDLNLELPEDQWEIDIRQESNFDHNVRGYIRENYTCHLAVRCYEYDYLSYQCDEFAPDLHGWDLAILHCEGAPGMRHGYTEMAEQYHTGANILIPWKHEVFNIDHSNQPLSASDFYNYYIKLDDIKEEKNIHYWRDHALNQPLPLVSTGERVGSRRVNAKGCHGTSGSGILQEESAITDLGSVVVSVPDYRLVSPQEGANGMHGRQDGYLCHYKYDDSDAGTADDTLYHQPHGRVLNVVNSKYALLNNDFYNHKSPFAFTSLGYGFASPLYINPFNVSYETVPNSIAPGNRQAPKVKVTHQGTTRIANYDLKAGTVYRVGFVARAQSALAALTARMNGQIVAALTVSDPSDAGKWMSVAGAYTALEDANGILDIESQTGEFDIMEVALVEEGSRGDFDTIYGRSASVVKVPELGHLDNPPVSSAPALPASYVQRGEGGYAAILRINDRLILNSRGISAGHEWNVYVKTAGNQDLHCGFVDTAGGIVSSYICKSGTVTRIPDLQTPAGRTSAFFVQPTLGNTDHVLVDEVVLASDVMPDSDGNGIYDVMEDLYVPWNACPYLAHVAVYGNTSAVINDRVVIRNAQGGGYALVQNAGHGGVRVGVDAYTGDISSVGWVWLRERAHVMGPVRTEAYVIMQNSVEHGAIDEYVDDLGLPSLDCFSVRYPTANDRPSIVLQAGDPDRVEAPGAFSQVIVGPGTELYLEGGNYYFDSLTIEPDGIIHADTSEASLQIYVRDYLLYKGEILDDDDTVLGDIFVGYTGTAPASIAGPFTGTIVAPNTRVSLETTPLNYYGAFFADTVAVHQDATVWRLPYVHHNSKPYDQGNVDPPPVGIGPCADICADPSEFTLDSGSRYFSLGTEAACFETVSALAGGNCGGFTAERTFTINGEPRDCNWQNWPSLPELRNGGYCIQVSAGKEAWASFNVWAP